MFGGGATGWLAVTVAQQGTDVVFTYFHQRRCVLIFCVLSVPLAALKKSERKNKGRKKPHKCRLPPLKCLSKTNEALGVEKEANFYCCCFL